MKILIIDDIIESVQGILDSCEDNSWDGKIVDFDNALSELLDFDPDVIVLDWKDDIDGVNVGESILDKIWRSTFRPIILFTANAGTIDVSLKENQSNKMLCVIPKGDEEPVIEQLKSIAKFAPALSHYRENIGQALILAISSIQGLKQIENIEDLAIGYTLSKRTSAFFDDQYISTLAPSWVQYLCPPVSECLNVCDIIRVKSEGINFQSAGKPEEYYIILTPSCDMQSTEGRAPKVSHVLCARCFPKEDFHSIPLSSPPSSRNTERVKSMLNSGYSNNCIALPEYAGVIPYMTANLKKPELISLTDIEVQPPIDTTEKKYFRVASICSPFREQIVWAYMQSACRPGVPDRNMELWAKDILSE